jgi:hypothetical protein
LDQAIFCVNVPLLKASFPAHLLWWALCSRKQRNMETHNIQDRTLLIAKVVSMYLLITGLGFLISDEYYRSMIAHTESDPVLINLSGMVHFFIGMTILVIHFQWKGMLQIVVTILGAMFFIKGAFLIVLPDLMLQTGNNPAQITSLMAVIFIVVGTALGYFAYFHKANLHNQANTADAKNRAAD